MVTTLDPVRMGSTVSNTVDFTGSRPYTQVDGSFLLVSFYVMGRRGAVNMGCIYAASWSGTK